MQEKLVPLTLPPGLFGNGTSYQAKGRWLRSVLVRFINKTIGPIGRWRALTDSAGATLGPLTVGCPSFAYAYRGDGGSIRMGIGSNNKLHVITEGALYDITPADLVAGSCSGSYEDGTGAYGAGAYGAGPYGGISLSSTLNDADVWTLDSFGEYLVGVLPSDGRLLVWQGNTANDAAEAPNAPINNRAVVVTPERFLVALGANGDARLVKWASQETINEWDETVDGSTAGEQPLATAGRLMAGRRTRRQTLLWTDVDMWTMTYIGDDFIYSFDQGGDNCGLLGPNAVAIASTQAFWMGQKGFFRFDGFVRPLHSEVADRVFSDINKTQRALVWATTVAEHHEVWWFYPSRGSTVPNKYVVYNYAEDHWNSGDLERAAGVDRGAMPSPVWIDNDGNIFEHESDEGDYGGVLPSITTGPLEIGDGDQVMRLQRLVPDELAAGEVTVSVRRALMPLGPFSDSTEYTMHDSTPVSMRETGRQIQLTFTGVSADDDWRIGTFRLGVRPQGKR
jgi:hypothetical protein